MSIIKKDITFYDYLVICEECGWNYNIRCRDSVEMNKKAEDIHDKISSHSLKVKVKSRTKTM